MTAIHKHLAKMPTHYFYNLNNFTLVKVLTLKYGSRLSFKHLLTSTRLFYTVFLSESRNQEIMENMLSARFHFQPVRPSVHSYKDSVIAHESVLTGTFLKRDCTTKSLFLFKKCCFWGVKFDFKV